jgi:hypothetical protein
MFKNILIIGIVLLALAGAAMYIFPKKPSNIAANSSLYCSPNGTLTNTKPIQSHRSYCIKSDLATMPLAPNTPVPFTFSIIDDQGNTLKDFEIAHDMLLHLIVVRKDLANFQHLHPNFNATSGAFILSDLTFPTAGEYRIYADFLPKGMQMGPDGMPLNVVATQDTTVTGTYTPQALVPTPFTKTFDAYTVTLKTDPVKPVAGSMAVFSFTVRKDGKLVTDLQPYLAALGHSVVLREGTLDYIHAHALQQPTDKQVGTVDFHIDLSQGGNYKVFTQFKHQDKVITTDFVVTVAGGSSQASPAQNTQNMDHSMH